jgi:hypothetical protein
MNDEELNHNVRLRALSFPNVLTSINGVEPSRVVAAPLSITSVADVEGRESPHDDHLSSERFLGRVWMDAQWL